MIGENMELKDLVLQKMNTEQKNILLLSKGGGGKTTQLINLCNQLLQSNSDKRIIPVYISLNSYDGQRDYITKRLIDSFLGVVTSYDIETSVTNMRKLVLSNSNRHVLLMIDGLNETSMDTASLIGEIKQLSILDNLQIILTSRYIIKLDKRLFGIYKVETLNDNILSEKIHNYNELNEELKKLLHLPLYLRQYLSIKDESKTRIATATELIDEYFKFQLDKIEDSVGLKYKETVENILNDFLPNYLYSHIYNTKRYMVVEKSDIFVFWERYIENTPEVKYTIKLNDKSCVDILQELGIIKDCHADGLYVFYHESYLDYFLHKFFVKKINKPIIDGLEIATEIVWYYDENKHDKMSAYIYGKQVLEKLKYIHTDNANELIRVAHLYSVIGYSVLHAKKFKHDAIKISEDALKKAEDLLGEITVQNLAENQQKEFYTVSTIQHGNMGAYYLVTKDYKEALNLHEKSLKERQTKLNDRAMIATAYKNIGTDHFYLSNYMQLSKMDLHKVIDTDWKECSKELQLSFENHREALDMYRNIYPKTNLNTIICLNRMIGSGIKLFEINLFKLGQEVFFGQTSEKALESFLLDCKIISDYFQENITVTDEIENCIKNIEDIIYIMQQQKATSNDLIDIIFSIFNVFETEKYFEKRISINKEKIEKMRGYNHD